MSSSGMLYELVFMTFDIDAHLGDFKDGRTQLEFICRNIKPEHCEKIYRLLEMVHAKPFIRVLSDQFMYENKLQRYGICINLTTEDYLVFTMGYNHLVDEINGYLS